MGCNSIPNPQSGLLSVLNTTARPKGPGGVVVHFGECCC